MYIWLKIWLFHIGSSSIYLLSHTGNDSDAKWCTAGGASSAPIGRHASGQSAEDKSFKLEQTFSYVYFSDQLPTNNPEILAQAFEVC